MKDEIKRFKGKSEFLSNYFKHDFVHKGIIFKTAEHAFHWEKAITSLDKEKIASFESASEAKKYGRKIKCDIEEWNKTKFSKIKEVLVSKFKDANLKQLLLETKKKILTEGNNWHDNIWGNCTCTKCKEIPGQNNLGKLLMEIRKELE